jgi:hypothetical protein
MHIALLFPKLQLSLVTNPSHIYTPSHHQVDILYTWFSSSAQAQGSLTSSASRDQIVGLHLFQDVHEAALRVAPAQEP